MTHNVQSIDSSFCECNDYADDCEGSFFSKTRQTIVIFKLME